MNTTKMRMMHSATHRSCGSNMASHFIEAMETAQRPPLKIVSASRRFCCLILAAFQVPGLGQMRTIVNAQWVALVSVLILILFGRAWRGELD
jgi:hypothetical protein